MIDLHGLHQAEAHLALTGFLRQHPSLSTMTVHRYPLVSCFSKPGQPQYPTIGHLMSPYSTVQLADGVKRWVSIAHTEHRKLRVDELTRTRSGVLDVLDAVIFAASGAGMPSSTMVNAPAASRAFASCSSRWPSSPRRSYTVCRSPQALWLA